MRDDVVLGELLGRQENVFRFVLLHRVPTTVGLGGALARVDRHRIWRIEPFELGDLVPLKRN